MPDPLPESPPRPPAPLALPSPARPDAAAATPPTTEGEAALAAAQAFARQAVAPATPRAYKADWQHYAAWCARLGFVPVPATPPSASIS